MTTLTPFLMFTGEAAAAAAFYVATFGGRVVAQEKRDDGTLQRCEIELAGQRIRLFDSPVPHAFGFTPALSLFVDFDTREALDRAAAALGDGGKQLMPPNDYGFSRWFCWLEDRYGVSWQLNLP